MWEIIIEKSAREYLEKKKSKDIYIEPVERKVCCSSYRDFTVSAKVQNKTTEFEVVEADPYRVHICNDLSVKNNKIQIACDKFMMFERLYLKNISYDFNRNRGSCNEIEREV